MKSPYQIKVLDKAVKILDLFTEKGQSISAAQISQTLKLNRSTAFRILSVLERSGYLERSPKNLGYRLGFKLFHLGSLVEGISEIRSLARPSLEKLVSQCDETVHLTILDDGEARYIDKIEGKKAVRVVSRIGMKLPAHCSGVGKVLLAALPEKELEILVARKGLPRFTPNTITNLELLKLELAQVRKNGFAIDHEEIELGLKCVAAPVKDYGGQVIAAVSVSGPKERFGRAELERLIPLVMAATAEISARLKVRGITQAALAGH